MRPTLKALAINLFTATAAITAAGSVWAQTCIDPPAINGFPTAARAPTNWTIKSPTTPDIIWGNGSYPDTRFNLTVQDVSGVSSSGGVIALFLSNPSSDYFSEGLTTTLTNLIPGSIYNVAIEWQLARISGSQRYAGGYLNMDIAGTSKQFTSSGSVGGDGWQVATVTFKATRATETLTARITGMNEGDPATIIGGAIVIDSGAACSNYTIVTDTTPPVASYSPVDGANSVAANGSITITFDEAIRLLDDSILNNNNVDNIISLKANNSSGADIPFNATINGNVITITPTTAFNYSQQVYVALDEAVEDYIDNAASPSSATFTIEADTTGPTFTFNPANASSNIALNTNITITASETIRLVAGNASIDDNNVSDLITLKDTGPNGADIPFNATIAGNVITITPTGNFSASQQVYVAIDGAAVEDGADNAGAESAVTFSTLARSLSSATYDATTGNLVVTGTSFIANTGASNDVDVSLLTFTGEGGATYTLTSNDVEIDSETQFTVTLNAADKVALEAILNKNGTTSDGGTTYNIAAAEDWMLGAPVEDDIADLAGNGVTVSGLDETSPVFDAGTPSVSTITNSSFIPVASIDEAGIIYYVVVANGDGAPSSAQVQNGLNSGGSLAISNGSITVFSGDFTATFPAITSLTPDTAYEIYFVAEDTAQVPNVQSSPTQVSVRTLATDSDADLTASGTVTEPVGLDTTIDSAGEAIDLFDFTISDGGTSDGFATIINQIVVNVSGTTSDSVRNKITWRLNGPDVSNVTGTYNPSNDTITFSNLSVAIADGGSETYTINGYFNENTGLIEDQTFIFSIDGDTDLTLDPSGTQMGATSAVTNSTGGTIDVVASVLAFTTQPAGSTSGSALSTQPVVSAQDAFGNTDVDFTETVTLTEASAGTLTNSSVAAVSGVATFTGVVYTATADQQIFTITANDQDGVGTDLSSVTADSVTSDVIAIALQFSTQPGPLAVEDRLATSFTTVPVVRAVDSNGIVDTGYSTGITLSEINGAGAATMTGTGDTDSDGATVTILPASGVATFTGLTITYTQSGGSDETFNLRATSGSLAVANSSQLTSSDTITPSGYSAAFDQIGINSSNETTASFTFAGAEVGASYTYTISSSGGGTNVTGTTGTVSTPTDQISNIDVSGLGDGTLTLSVKLTDAAGNEGQEATDTVAKDATAPSGYSVSFDQDSVNDGNQTAIGFTFANAEVGANYFYIIVSSGGGTEVTGTGTITSASQSILDLNLSGLTDGTLVLSVRLVDPAGNMGSNALDSIAKDVLAPIAPASLSLAESSNSGSTADTLTNDTTATINGTAEANATVTVYVDDTEVGTTTADSSGNWNFTFSDGDLTTGENSITAIARDTAGNVSPTSSALLIIIDTDAPTLVVSGPAEPVTEAFTVTFTFSENVTGFTAGDVTLAGGTLSNFSGSGSTYTALVTPTMGETVTVSVPANAAQDASANGNEASNTYTIQAGSPASEFEANRAAIEQVLVDDMMRAVRSSVSTSSRMVRDARGRLISMQQCADDALGSELGAASSDRPETSGCTVRGLANTVTPLSIDGTASASAVTVSTSGIVTAETSTNYGQSRRLFYGDFDIQRDNDTGSTTATLSGRMSWEQMVQSDTMLGYFVGAEFANSDLNGEFAGDQSRIGVTAGGYVVQRLSEHLYADGYLSVGLGDNDLDITNGTLDLESSYQSQSVTAGVAFSGYYAFEQYEFRPELALTHGLVELGTVNFSGNAYGITDDSLSLRAGSVAVTNLTLRPEMLFSLSDAPVAHSNAVASFAPRLICERTSATLRADTDHCGSGAEFGLKVGSEDGLSTMDLRVAVDEIANSRRSTAQLGAEVRF